MVKLGVTLYKNCKNSASTMFWLLGQLRNLALYKKWSHDFFSSPSPTFIKHVVLSRFPTTIWIETGTYHGDTTRVLAEISEEVTTIEASKELFDASKEKFFNQKKINLLFGDSGRLMKSVLDQYIEEDKTNINFFLDAHFSGGKTYSSGISGPILNELKAISERLPSLNQVTIFVDDFRLFCNSSKSKLNESDLEVYPDAEYLVRYAANNNLSWTVEHDLFIMQNSAK